MSDDRPASLDLAALPPLAIAEVARVLRYGGAKHGCEPSATGGGQGIDDHLQHARAHLEAIESYEDADRETGALHLIHAAARLLLAAELVMGARE